MHLEYLIHEQATKISVYIRNMLGWDMLTYSQPYFGWIFLRMA